MDPLSNLTRSLGSYIHQVRLYTPSGRSQEEPEHACGHCSRLKGFLRPRTMKRQHPELDSNPVNSPASARMTNQCLEPQATCQVYIRGQAGMKIPCCLPIQWAQGSIGHSSTVSRNQHDKIVQTTSPTPGQQAPGPTRQALRQGLLHKQGSPREGSPSGGHARADSS